MKFVNQLKKSLQESPKSRATRPVVKPRKRVSQQQLSQGSQDEQFLFI